jgi:hypothetical protein
LSRGPFALLVVHLVEHMAQIITVVYNREDASEVVDVQVKDTGEIRDLLKKGVTVKQAVDFLRAKDPVTILQGPAQKGVFISDVEKSSALTAEEKRRFTAILLDSSLVDVAVFGIGDKPSLIPSPVVDVPVQKPPIVIVFVDP